MEPRKEPTPAWYHVVTSARPLLLTAIEFLIHTKKFGPHSNALRLLSVAIDHILPANENEGLIAALRKTRNELPDLGEASAAERLEILTQLKDQLTELQPKTDTGGTYEPSQDENEGDHASC